MVQWLVEHGADVNAKDEWNKTALHYAAYNYFSDNYGLVLWLAERGADVNIKGVDGITVLDIAAGNGDIELVQSLVEHGADLNPGLTIHEAAISGNMELVQWLIEQGLDVNAKDEEERTILFNAVESGNLELVQWLVEQGLDVNAKDDEGISVLQAAEEAFEENHNPKIVKFLKERGAV